MDLFPLYNSLRIAAIASVMTFFGGIFAAYYVSKAPRVVKATLDVLFTLPLVLPPTVTGFFILKLLGTNGALGSLVMRMFETKLIMKWYSAVFAGVVVSFPLMYRTARGAFETFDVTLWHSGRTLGLSNTYIFWRVMLPVCKRGIIAGAILAFARAIGEYGATSMVAGYTPGRTATISTTVYQLWRTGDDKGAYTWVLINVALSVVVLFVLNALNGPPIKRKGKVTG